MATATKNNRTTTDEVQAAADRLRDLNEKIIENGRKAGNTYLDLYEKTLKTIADFGERAGSQSQIEWVQAFAKTQADLTREIADAYVQASRQFLK